jgi:hypothetical protein
LERHSHLAAEGPNGPRKGLKERASSSQIS